MISKEDSGSFCSIKKIGTILIPFFIYFVVHDLAEILFWGILEMLAGIDGAVISMQEHGGTLKEMGNGIAVITAMLSIYKISATEIRTAYPKKKTNETGRRLFYYFLLSLCALGFAIGMNLLFYQTGLTESSQKFAETAAAQYDLDFMAGLLLYGVISPLAEETLFRGAIYQRMKKVFPVPLSIVLSSVLFGAYHRNLVQALYGSILGILITLSYEMFQSFAAPVLFHAVANLCVFTLTYRHGIGAVLPQQANLLMLGMLLLATLLFYLLWRWMKEKSDP